MKYLVINDEHELYQRMFADLFQTDRYQVEEIPRMVVPRMLQPLYRLHYHHRINRHISLPGKMLWKSCYRLHQYSFREDETYCVIFLNGSLRYHFSEAYLQQVKARHPNVRYALILYDSISNMKMEKEQTLSLIPLFDYVLSFDEEDCRKYGYKRIYSSFSRPKFLREDRRLESKAFFIGVGLGRLEFLQEAFRRITSRVKGCRFYIVNVKEKEQREIKDVVYNRKMTYEEELQMAYNTQCVVEIVKEGQAGVSLRTCEAVAFDKKLLTNNKALKRMPFYDERYMRVFDEIGQEEIDFLERDLQVHYEDNAYFSPIKIVEAIEHMACGENGECEEHE